MVNRLIVNWVYGGFLAGVLLLALAPILTHSWPASLVCTFLCLPIYMLHQYEEHDNDRFRVFLNDAMGKGREVLSPTAVFVINVPGVWGVIGVSIALAATVNIGLGLIAVYLVVVNGLIHVAHAIIFRKYNPGLGTAIGLFLPLGGYGIMAIQKAGGGMAAMHATGVAAAVGIHAVIIAHVARQ
ncbi:MAG: HXXEE domain-containing protein [Terriglobia bacterium]